MPKTLAHCCGSLLTGPALGLALGLALSGSALAGGIQCDRGYQLVKGDSILTPYCQDEYLAQVAREFGFSASAQKIHHDPLYKKAICRYIFTDIRVQETCLQAGVPEIFGGAH
jgi:hypothetical protein